MSGASPCAGLGNESSIPRADSTRKDSTGKGEVDAENHGATNLGFRKPGAMARKNQYGFKLNKPGFAWREGTVSSPVNVTDVRGDQRLLISVRSNDDIPQQSDTSTALGKNDPQAKFQALVKTHQNLGEAPAWRNKSTIYSSASNMVQSKIKEAGRGNDTTSSAQARLYPSSPNLARKKLLVEDRVKVLSQSKSLKTLAQERLYSQKDCGYGRPGSTQDTSDQKELKIDLYRPPKLNQQQPGWEKHSSDKPSDAENTPYLADMFRAGTPNDSYNPSKKYQPPNKTGKYMYYRGAQNQVTSTDGSHVTSGSSTRPDSRESNYNQTIDKVRQTTTEAIIHNNIDSLSTGFPEIEFSGRQSILDRKMRLLNNYHTKNKIGYIFNKSTQNDEKPRAEKILGENSYNNVANISSEVSSFSERPRVSKGAIKLVMEHYINAIRDGPGELVSDQEIDGKFVRSENLQDKVNSISTQFVEGDMSPHASTEDLSSSSEPNLFERRSASNNEDKNKYKDIRNPPEESSSHVNLIGSKSQFDITEEPTDTDGSNTESLNRKSTEIVTAQDEVNNKGNFKEYNRISITYGDGTTGHDYVRYIPGKTKDYVNYKTSRDSYPIERAPTLSSTTLNLSHTAPTTATNKNPTQQEGNFLYWPIKPSSPKNYPRTPSANPRDYVYDKFTAATSRPLTLSFRQQLDLQSSVLELLEGLYGKLSTDLLVDQDATAVLRLIASLDPAWLLLTWEYKRPLMVNDFPADAWAQLVRRTRVSTKEIISDHEQAPSGHYSIGDPFSSSRYPLWCPPSRHELSISPRESSLVYAFSVPSGMPYTLRPPHGRGVLIRNLPPDLTLAELFTHLGGGPLERVDFQDGEGRKVVGLYFLTWQDAGRYREFVNRNGGICWGGGVVPGRSLYIPRSFVEVIPGRKGGDEEIKARILRAIENEGATRCLLITRLPFWITRDVLIGLARRQSNIIRAAIEFCEVGNDPKADPKGHTPKKAVIYMASIGTALGCRLILASRRGFSRAVYRFLPDPCASTELESLGRMWRDADYRDSQSRLFESRVELLQRRMILGSTAGR